MELDRMLSQSATAASKINMIILKEPNSSAVDRDAGFCSGGDEDDLEAEDNINSPTDGSEDSIEVKVSPIFQRNKRKCVEPRKKNGLDDLVQPLKKRICSEVKPSQSPSPSLPVISISSSITPATTNAKTLSLQMKPQLSHFRPWNVQYPATSTAKTVQDEPLSLVKTEPVVFDRGSPENSMDSSTVTSNRLNGQQTREVAPLPILLNSPDLLRHRESMPPRVPPHPAVRPPSATEMALAAAQSPGAFKPSNNLVLTAHQHLPPASSSSTSSHSHSARKEQRNYKNMTRERRIEANARERTRVHTISAAFDTLRRAVPAYSHNQKLSKLSVLRIACSYILTLSRVAGDDYSADKSAPSIMSCVDSVTRTIQTEGKLRKKKDE